MRMIHDKNGEAKGYIKMLLRKYKKSEMSFNDFVEETKAVESFIDNLLLDNIKVFKDRVRNNILSWAVLDGGIFYCFETTQKYLDAGLSRRVLIKWLKKNLPYEYGIDDGAESEDIDYDFVVLELCQLLRKYGFSVRTIESVLRTLKEDARVFFLMNTTQRDEWLKIGINPRRFRDRCLRYPVQYWNLDFHRKLVYCIKDVPSDMRGILVGKMVDSNVFKTQDLMKIDESQGEVVDFLVKSGADKRTLAEKFVRDVGTEYDQYSREEVGYAINLLPEADGTLDSEKILDSDKIWDMWKKTRPRRNEFNVWDFVEVYYEDSYW